MYSQDKIDIALQVYHQCGSVTKIIRVLGYPTRRALYTWIGNEGIPKPLRKEPAAANTAEHPRDPSLEVKLDALHRCFELGEGVKPVSEEIGYTWASIYAWRKKYLRGGTAALKNDKNILPGTLKEGKAPAPPDETGQLHARMQDMRLKIGILEVILSIPLYTFSSRNLSSSPFQ